MTSARQNHTIRLKLGTRGSALAMAQSRIIANALLREHPDLRIELIAVETRGDRDQRTPLSDVKDADFFSAELDATLINHGVDFCVHSVKDLGTDRPAEIFRAAIPVRENPRDVIVFRDDVIERLRQGQPVRIGSSSTRRKVNVEHFLMDALPQFNRKPRLHFSPLRGAVTDRLNRIHVDPDKPDALDGVVLALAGLNRLWRDPAGRKIIAPLLTRVRWMVLPPSPCPAAPGQGALALECRRDDDATRTLLGRLHDPATAALVQRELDFMQALPGTRNPGFGVTALNAGALGPVMYVRGPHAESNGAIWERPPAPARARPWDGRQAYRSGPHQSRPVKVPMQASDTLFVAHWHAVTESVSVHSATRIWVSGVQSWQRLAMRGLWVEGCADNLGFSDIVSTLACDVLDLPALNDWTVLTHHDAKPGWDGTGIGRIIATYAPAPAPNSADLEKTVRQATHFFWGSAGQYRSMKAWVPTDAHHACGAGKTADALRALGLDEPQAFPSRKEWQAWLR